MQAAAAYIFGTVSWLPLCTDAPCVASPAHKCSSSTERSLTTVANDHLLKKEKCCSFLILCVSES